MHFNVENPKLPITPSFYVKFLNSQSLNIHSPKSLAMELLESSSYRKRFNESSDLVQLIIIAPVTFSRALHWLPYFEIISRFNDKIRIALLMRAIFTISI